MAVAAPRRRELFIGFLWLGLSGFGGVLPLARRMLVDRQRWLTGSEFSELLGLCQFLPGGNAVNLSLAVGLRYGGLAGAAAAIGGLLAAPCVVVVALGALYGRFHSTPWIVHGLAGLSAAAGGLLAALAVRMWRPLWAGGVWRKAVSLGVAACCVGAIAIARAPLLPTLVVLAPVSIWLAGWER